MVQDIIVAGCGRVHYEHRTVLNNDSLGGDTFEHGQRLRAANTEELLLLLFMPPLKPQG